MDNNRKTAFLILREVEERKAYSNISASKNILRSKPPSPAFVRELVYSVIRNKKYLDYIISGFVKTPINKIDVADITLIRMGLSQILFLDSVPEYAAVNETVNLSKRYANGRSGFINGVLRQYLRDKDYVELPKREDDEIKYLSILYSYEPWIIEKLIEDYGIERAESLLIAGNKVPGLTVRSNSLKIQRDDLAKRLEKKGYTVEKSERFDTTMDVKGDSIIASDLYKAGMFSIQDEAALMVVKMLNPKPDETVVDVCAAPGGKTMAIAEAMNDFGTIYAIDYYKSKLTFISEAARRLGVTIVTSWSWNATRSDPDLVDKADKVLIDVPCSGLGTVRKKPEIKYKEWGEDMKNLPQKQLDILTSSSKYLKRGGILVYSTCTLLKRENEDVVRKFLRSDNEFERLETKKMYPDTDGTDGFFICKLRRKEKLI